MKGSVKNIRKTSGIALVVVLGVIALLMIIGVGFSISMRIERMAARSYADTVRGRMLMQAAVARTMSDVNAYMADPTADLLVYPDWVAYASPADSSMSNGVIPDLISDEALSFIPAGLRTDALAEANNVRWRDIEDPDGNFMGRYAYLLVDCSGFVDASTASQPAAQRNEGKVPAELLINELTPEFGGDAESFLTKRRDEWRRFESIPDLWTVGRRSGGGLSAEPENLFVFSRFTPDGFWDGTSLTNRINIGGSVAELEANRSEIEAALVRAGIASADVAAVFDNLLDYVDDNFEPRGDFNSFSTEPVPMINEIVFSNMVTRTTLPEGGGTRYQHDVYVTIETWYPFPGNVSVVVNFDPTTASFTTAPLELNPTASDFVGATPAEVAHGENSFRSTTFHWRKVTDNVPFPGAGVLGIRLLINGPVSVIYDGVEVDRVAVLNGLPPQLFQLRMSDVPTADSPVMPQTPRSASVVDPRFNHIVDTVIGWALDNPTPEGINDRTRDYNAGEGVSPMYVRNRPLGEEPVGSVAELGFLNVGSPWRTIALYNAHGTNLHEVLDLFTIETSPAARQGLVNINSPNPQVVAAVFNGLPVRPIPNGSDLATMNWSQATTYADEITGRTENDFIYNISAIGDFNRNFFIGITDVGVGMTDADIESIIRHSYELFGVRQNLFTAIIAAQIMSPQGEVPIVDQRAVAVIWRDPFPNANGHHASFVRFFKPLVE